MKRPIKRRKSSAERRIDRAISIAFRYRAVAGERHRLWTIDQMMRALMGSKYKETIQAALLGSYHPIWDPGDAP